MVKVKFFRAHYALVSACVCMLFSGCYQEPEVVPSVTDVTVTFPDFEITMSESRAAKSASEAGVSHIVLKAFDASGTAVSTETQVSSDSEFGTMHLALASGEYTFVAVANADANAPTITSSTVAALSETSNPTLYTCKKEEVSVTGTGSKSVAMAMGVRKNAQLRLKILDDNLTSVAAVQVIVNPSGATPSSLAFNPTTGLATTSNKYERTIVLSEHNITSLASVTLGSAILLSAATQSLTVTVNMLSESNAVLYTKTFTNVPFKQGEATMIKGTFFSTAVTGSFSFDTSMEETVIDLNS